DDPRDDVVVVQDSSARPMDRSAELTEPDLRALLHGCDVPDTQRRTVLRGDDGVLDVGDVPDLTDGPDVDLLQSGLDEASAAVHVVVRELLLDLAQVEAICDQLVRIDTDLILTGRTAETDDIDDIRYGLELLCDRPILERFELHDVVQGIR